MSRGVGSREAGRNEKRMSGEADVGLWARIAGGFATAAAVLFGGWKYTHRRIDGAYAAIADKASLEEMNRQRDNIATLFAQAREDRAAIMSELGNTNELLRSIQVGVTEKLGLRPTREEVHQLIRESKT